ARAIDVAKTWITYGKPMRARVAAVLCLGKLGEAHEARRTEIIDLLGSLTGDPEFRLKINLPEAFATLKVPEVIPHLQRLVDQELDGRIRRFARRALEAIKEGRGAAEATQNLQRDLDALREEQRQLRDRLDRLEAGMRKTETLS